MPIHRPIGAVDATAETSARAARQSENGPPKDLREAHRGGHGRIVSDLPMSQHPLREPYSKLQRERGFLRKSGTTLSSLRSTRYTRRARLDRFAILGVRGATRSIGRTGTLPNQYREVR